VKRALIVVGVVALFATLTWADTAQVLARFFGGFYVGPRTQAVSTNNVTSMLSTTATLDFANKTITCEDLDTVVLNGAKPGDPCLVSPGAYVAQAGNGSYSCFVKDDGGIAVRHCAAGTASNPDAGPFRIRVISSQ
jgi:hypothetical protein